MKALATILVSLCLFASPLVHAQVSAWEEDFLVPPGGRSNPYALSADDYDKAIQRGRIHTQIYPVSVTGILPPYEPLKKFFESESKDPFRTVVRTVLSKVVKVDSLSDIFHWIGLHPYPSLGDEGIYSVPYPDNIRPETP
ncbi:MAG: hypothetical protein KF789_08380, partial [Bdellovibrionaceae bacterium]|nr:hypothetical protein [Pseudobdellovibrionaceae bacterium]